LRLFSNRHTVQGSESHDANGTTSGAIGGMIHFRSTLQKSDGDKKVA